MNELEEKKYWRLFVEGDLEALSVIFQSLINGLISYGLSICQDEELVKDSIQEVFVKLIRKRTTIDHQNNVRGLVYRLLRNQLIDEIKFFARNKEKSQQMGYLDDCFEYDAEYWHIWNEDDTSKNSILTSALEKLSCHQKEVLFLKYSSGLSYEQISQIMEISVASVRTLIYRTLKQLKSEIFSCC